MVDSSTSNTEAELFDRPMMDEPDEAYVMAGRLLGSEWNLPDSDNHTDQIQSVHYRTTSGQGHTMAHPEVELRYSGRTFRVDVFLQKANPNAGTSDVEPANELAHRVVEWCR